MLTVAAEVRVPATLPAAKIIVADDHPLVCAALTHTLRAAMPDGLIETAATLCALEQALAHHSDLDLVLLDLNMPGAQGISSLLLLRGLRPDLPVIVVSANDRPRTVALAQQFGASGFLSKSAPLPVLLTAIDAVLRGATWFPSARREKLRDDDPLAARLALLTPQQMRVLMYIGDGLLNKQIAHELCLAENTVKVHVTAILHKLGCHTRTRAAVLLRSTDADIPSLRIDDREAASA